jgi:hypothetical protein
LIIIISTTTTIIIIMIIITTIILIIIYVDVPPAPAPEDGDQEHGRVDVLRLLLPQ